MSKRRWTAIATSIALLVALLGLGPRGIAHAAQANQEWFGPYWSYLGYPSGGGSYINHIHNFQAPDKCLEVPGWAFYTDYYVTIVEHDASGAQVQLWTCEPQDTDHDWGRNQIWNQHDNGDGSWSYYVTGNSTFGPPGGTDYCLDSLGGHHYNGSPVEVFPCNYGPSQRWTIGPSGQLQSVDSPGYCADDTNWGTSDGSQIQLWQCAY
jgi:hypothetical protein